MRLVKSAGLNMLWVLLLTGCAWTGGKTAEQLLSRPAPAFSLTSIDGQRISLAELRGKVVVIDFWATWCPPCRESLPRLQMLAADPAMRKAGLVVLAVNEEEYAVDVRSFLGQGPYSSTIVLDKDGAVAREYAVETIPTTIVVGRDGLVRAVIGESTPDSAHQLDEAIAIALQ